MLLAAATESPVTQVVHVSPLAWGLTIGGIVALILVDLLVFQRPHTVSVKEAAIGSLAWTVLGLSFALVVWSVENGEAASQYLTGFLLERTLSVDNVFVFVLILGYFAVPERVRPRALLIGVVIALILRAIFIFVGAELLEKFEVTFIVFGAILLYSAFALAKGGNEEVDPQHNLGLRILRRFVPVSDEFEGTKLTTRLKSTGQRAVTPFFAVLIVIGTTDLVFAVDSIPAIFSITQDTYLVFTANAFSLLGLIPLSFLLAGIMHRFVYLKPGLALILALVGAKMIALYFDIHVNTYLSLAIIAVILAGAIGLSLVRTKAPNPAVEGTSPTTDEVLPEEK